jgi:putative salt-induced outer membrane protein
MLRFSLALTAAALAFATQAAHAQAQTDGRWHGGVSLGGAASSGNSSSRTLSGAADASNATADDKTSLYALANYGKSTVGGIKTTTADLLRLGGRYDFNLTKEVFAFSGLEGETNKVGGVNNRYNLNGGVGYKLVRTANASVDLFAGLTYSDTKFTDGSKRSGATGLLGEEGSYKLSDTTSIKQRLVFYPGSGEVGSRATFDTGLATQIAGGWTLNTGLSARYADKVPAGTKKTDTLVTVGFGYKY